jgi:hypothetical protein
LGFAAARFHGERDLWKKVPPWPTIRALKPVPLLSRGLISPLKEEGFMSRAIVRRVTSAVLLLSILCFALPAAATPARRAQTSKAPVAFGSNLIDQVFSWLSSLWPGHEPRPQSSQQKSGGVISTNGGVESTAHTIESDRGAMIDPNGGH